MLGDLDTEPDEPKSPPDCLNGEDGAESVLLGDFGPGDLDFEAVPGRDFFGEETVGVLFTGLFDGLLGVALTGLLGTGDLTETLAAGDCFTGLFFAGDFGKLAFG